MKTWNVDDARSCFPELMRRALAAEPQRVGGEGPGAVVVLSEEEYERLVGRKVAPVEGTPVTENRQSLVEFMRNSPLADAFRDGDLPEDIFDQIRAERSCAVCHPASLEPNESPVPAHEAVR